VFFHVQLNDENEQPSNCVKKIEAASQDEMIGIFEDWYQNKFVQIMFCSCGHRHIHAEFDKETKTMSYVDSSCDCPEYIMHTIATNQAEIKELWKNETEYYRYIESKDWKIRAGKKRVEAGMRCAVCGRGFPQVELHVHHNSYKNLGHELPIDLAVLCAEHHRMFEKTGGIKQYTAPTGFRKGRILIDDMIKAGLGKWTHNK
jgi:hypothetical protein